MQFPRRADSAVMSDPLGHPVGDLKIGERVLLDAGLVVGDMLEHPVPAVVGDPAGCGVELARKQVHAETSATLFDTRSC